MSSIDRDRWNRQAVTCGEASMIDSHDRRGYKNRYIETIIDAAIDRLIVKTPGLRILDFGCGTGKRVRRYIRDGHLAAGIEISAELLKLGLSDSGDTGAPYVLFDGIHLPFSSESFDLITSVGVLMYVLDQVCFDSLLREFVRILQPGASILFIEHATRFHRTSSRHEKVYRTIGEMDSRLRVAGFSRECVLPIRKGRFLPSWLGVRSGLIPSRFIPGLARFELRLRRYLPISVWDYYDVLYSYTKRSADRRKC